MSVKRSNRTCSYGLYLRCIEEVFHNLLFYKDTPFTMSFISLYNAPGKLSYVIPLDWKANETNRKDREGPTVTYKIWSCSLISLLTKRKQRVQTVRDLTRKKQANRTEKTITRRWGMSVCAFLELRWIEISYGFYHLR